MKTPSKPSPKTKQQINIRVALERASQLGYQEALRDILACLPEEKGFTPPEDLADHWGLTESSIGRQIENQVNTGFNSCLKLVHERISKLKK